MNHAVFQLKSKGIKFILFLTKLWFILIIYYIFLKTSNLLFALTDEYSDNLDEILAWPCSTASADSPLTII